MRKYPDDDSVGFSRNGMRSKWINGEADYNGNVRL